jgi:UDP-glucose 4-epimerase
MGNFHVHPGYGRGRLHREPHRGRSAGKRLSDCGDRQFVQRQTVGRRGGPVDLSKDFPFYQADILDETALDRIFSENRIQAVIHFAALKAVGESTRHPLEYYHNNVAAP